MSELNPYQTPQTAEQLQQDHDFLPELEKYRSSVGWTTMLVLGSAIMILGNLASFAAAMVACSHLEGVKLRDLAAANALRLAGQTQMVAGGIVIVAGLVSGICFLAWIYVASNNLEALGGKGKLIPIAKTLLCMIPCVSMITVPWMLYDLISRSLARSQTPKTWPSPGFAILYFLSQLVTVILGLVSSVYSNQSGDLDSLYVGEVFVAIQNVVAIFVMVYWLLLIFRVNRLQDDWYAAVSP